MDKGENGINQPVALWDCVYYENYSHFCRMDDAFRHGIGGFIKGNGFKIK